MYRWLTTFMISSIRLRLLMSKPVNYTKSEIKKGDWDMDRLFDEGHDKTCDMWQSRTLGCSCTVRMRGMEPDRGWFSHDEYEEPPVRKSKTARPKMGISGRSVKLLQRLIGRRGGKDV